LREVHDGQNHLVHVAEIDPIDPRRVRYVRCVRGPSRLACQEPKGPPGRAQGRAQGCCLDISCERAMHVHEHAMHASHACIALAASSHACALLSPFFFFFSSK
jgi:hypothetical protein